MSPRGTSRPSSSITTISTPGSGRPTLSRPLGGELGRQHRRRAGRLGRAVDVVEAEARQLLRQRGDRRLGHRRAAVAADAPARKVEAVEVRLQQARLYIAGTMTVCVMRSRAASSRNARALNSGITISVHRAAQASITLATSPVTWLAGTAITVRSAGPMRML